MKLAALPQPSFCPQCGDDWSEARREFCRRCGSPATGFSYDPLHLRFQAATPSSIDLRAKSVLRYGILGLGMVSILSGLLLSYGGWISQIQDPGFDVVQLWISRISGPMLVIQGLFYIWSPFRRPAAAKVIAFRRRLD
jgi:hypothetical protein